MAVCPPNGVVFRRSSSSSTPRPRPSSFLRTIINSLRCGTRSFSPSPTRRPSSIPLTHSPSKPPLSAYSDSGSVKLADLFNLSSSNSAPPLPTPPLNKLDKFHQISRAVTLLHSHALQDRECGAKLARTLAKEDGDARVVLAKLGAIPPLLEIIDDDQLTDAIRVQALYALLNLGIGNDLNKAAIVQAGAVHKMLKMTTSSNMSPDSSISEAIVANFLALSASDSNKPIIGSSGAIPFLLNILKELDSKCSSQSKQESLRAIYNLSILPSNIPLILENDLIRFLMDSMGEAEQSERILSILCNVTAASEGRKAISAVPDAFLTLIDVLSWNDSPGCQERASYVLMVMAHKSYSDRHKMIEAGIGSALLELTLIGSTLAQKRASRILDCLRVDKGKSARGFGFSSAAVSAPLHRQQPSSSSSSMRVQTSEETRAVKRLVHQSLQNNMRKIVRRANLPQDFVPSEHLKATLTSSSTSRSLPF